jgi:hypothetical protein
VERVNIVVNYDCPPDADSYLHRVGYASSYMVYHTLNPFPGQARWAVRNEGSGHHVCLFRGRPAGDGRYSIAIRSRCTRTSRSH